MLPVVSVVLGYGYVWWSMQQAAEEFTAGLKPMVDLKFEELYFDPIENQVGLRGISIQPLGVNETFRIQAVHFTTPDRQFWLAAEQMLAAGRWPEVFNTRIEGLNLNVAAINAAMPASLPMALDNDTALIRALSPCYSNDPLRQMTLMGYGDIRNDIELSYYLSRGNQLATTDLRWSMQGVMDINTHLEIPLAQGQINSAALMQGAAGIEVLSVAVQDRGYNNKRNRFCASREGIEPEQLVSNFEQTLRQQLAAQRFELPETFIKALVGLQKPGAQSYIELRPTANPMALMMVPPSEALAMLQPTLEVNGKRLNLQPLAVALGRLQGGAAAQPDYNAQVVAAESSVGAAPLAEPDASRPDSDGFSMGAEPAIVQPPVAQTEAAQPAGAEQVAALTPTVTLKKKPLAEQPPGFKEVPVRALLRYKQKRIRLRTVFGRTIEGKLVSADSQKLRIEERQSHGKAVYPLSLSNITLAEVYH